MDRARFLKTEAIVLKHFPLGEADRVLTLITPQAGKVRAVARGVRRPKSKLAGHLEPLTRTRVLIQRGRSMDTISQAETIESNIEVRQDLWRMTCALYSAELVERFSSEEQEGEAIYRLLRETITALAPSVHPELVGGETHWNPDITMRWFEVRLLDLSGFAPELYRCLDCTADVLPSAHFFSASAGGVLCPSCRAKDSLARPLSLNALKLLRLYSRGALQTAQQVRLPPDLSVEVEHIMRQYLIHTLERELKSTDFLDILRRERLMEREAASAAG
ncbi:MAG: DNA repair protein RecO [Chloroflexi bacterium]|nr:DNA repair protein RecO [Chloroflexota bacterium]